jgi:hypothetical protein
MHLIGTENEKTIILIYEVTYIFGQVLKSPTIMLTTESLYSFAKMVIFAGMRV